MVATKLQNFGGMLPAVDAHLLPPNSAALSRNTWLYSGAIQGFKALKKVYTPSNPATQKVFRVPVSQRDAGRIPNSYWLEFDSPNTDVVRSPVSGDSFERYYIASDGDRPRYITRAQIVDDAWSQEYIVGLAKMPSLVLDFENDNYGLPGEVTMTLGVPAPPVAPGVDVVGGSAPREVRAYVYTWVTAFGEEGPPSPPTITDQFIDGVWNISVTVPDADANDRRQLEKVRIYRTVSGVGGETDYFFVTEMDITETEFDDNIASVTSNQIIQSLFWTEPPIDLQGFAAMPNGIIAAWRGNEIWFCEPYRPHAWPANYQIAVDARVVGCGVIGQTLIVCTEVSVFAVTGINPASMAQARLAQFEPCVSRGSIVSTPAGVAFASPNGLVLANASGVALLTREMMQKEDWSDLLYLPTVNAATFNSGYYAFGSTAIGCFSDIGFDPEAFLQSDLSGAFSGAYIEPNDNRVAVSELSTDVPVRNVYPDIWTNEVFVHRDDGVFWLDQTRQCAEPRQPYIWRSKILETPASGNFRAMRVYFSLFRCSPELNPVQDTSQDQELKPDQYGLVRVYADGVLRFVRELRKSGEFFGLPSGFKATHWQIEIEARVRIESAEIATTARELGRV